MLQFFTSTSKTENQFPLQIYQQVLETQQKKRSESLQFVAKMTT